MAQQSQKQKAVSRDWILGLILLLAIILAYQPVWYAGFIWDDSLYVTANPCIIGPLGLKEIWTTRAANICPLTVTTFWVEHALWGLQPLPYHLVNVVLQGACAVLLWRVLQSLQVPGAWLGAALWALHPVQTDSVAWVAELKNTQSGLFYLLTILFFIKSLRVRENDNQNGWNYALTLLFAALAMASKSSTVILPVVLCLCAWWAESRWHWRNLIKVTPVFLMSVAAAGLAMWIAKMQGISSDWPWAQSWPERLVTAGDVVWFYLGKLLWPHQLITVYPRWKIDAGHWFSYLPLLAVIIVLLILWFKRQTWARAYFFAFAYFLVALLPVLGLVDMSFWRFSFVEDHLQYLASMGPLALAGAGLARYANSVLAKRLWLQSVLCAGLLLVLGALSWQRTWVYESQTTLWTDTLIKNPNCWVGRYNLGTIFLKNGQLDEAIKQFQKELEINPNDDKTHNNLGDALFQKGQVHEAIVQYQKALKINPDNATTHYNLGSALFQKGQVDEAIEQYHKALEIDPNYAKSQNNLGNALFQKGQVDEAIVQYQKALGINPNDDEAHNDLGVALAQKGQMDEALAQFQEAVRLKPTFRDAQSNLAKVKAMEAQKPTQK